MAILVAFPDRGFGTGEFLSSRECALPRSGPFKHVGPSVTVLRSYPPDGIGFHVPNDHVACFRMIFRHDLDTNKSWQTGPHRTAAAAQWGQFGPTRVFSAFQRRRFIARSIRYFETIRTVATPNAKPMLTVSGHQGIDAGAIT